MHNSIIRLSTSTDFSTATTVLYESGSFKRVSNYNKILDNAELILTTQNAQSTIDLVKEGLWVWVDNELKYIVDTYKKTRVSNFGGIAKWKVTLQLVSLTIILQKIIMPNKSISQPIAEGATQKTVKGEMEKLVELYGSQYKGITNWLVSYPSSTEIVDEYKWTQPTLFEALCDLASDANLTPRVGYNSANDLFIVYFENLTNDEGDQFDATKVNGLEINGSLENNPGRMVNVLSSAIASDTVKETNAYLKSAIGVMDDLDDTAFIPTTFNIEQPARIIVKGTLEERITSPGDVSVGHSAGYIEYDITDYVLEQSVFNALPTYGGAAYYKSDMNEYSNGNVYYKLGKKNIFGIRTPYKVAWTLYDGTFSIINILNHISQYNRTKIVTDIDTTAVFNHNTFYNDDEEDLVYDVEYKPIDSMRYDIVKDTGYGSMVQNQSDSYLSFSNYQTQQQDIMNRLGSEEVILMGQIFNESDLPENGLLYGEKLIVQTTIIEFKNHYNFMCVATSKFNRVDSDAVINTKKRFWQINTDNIVERNEFYEMYDNENRFDYVIANATHILLSTYKADTTGYADHNVYLNFIKQKIDDDHYLITATTLDNKFAGLQIYDEDNVRYVRGVFYADEDTGEFYKASIHLVIINPTTTEAWKHFPKLDFTTLNCTILNTKTDTLKYKDSAEKIAFSILYSKV